MSDPCNTTTTVTTTTASCSGPSCNCPPSPIPPWSRPVQSPLTQTIFGADTVILTMDTTYLRQAAVTGPNNTPQGPFAVAMPDGNYLRQFKRIYIPSDAIATTATFNLSGHFAGFTSLTFNTIAQSAVLEWDGAAWQLIGGNALHNP